MKKVYIKPYYEVVEVKLQEQILAGSAAKANGLDGAAEEEYTGGSVNW